MLSFFQDTITQYSELIHKSPSTNNNFWYSHSCATPFHTESVVSHMTCFGPWRRLSNVLQRLGKCLHTLLKLTCHVNSIMMERSCGSLSADSPSPVNRVSKSSQLSENLPSDDKCRNNPIKYHITLP